jgi:hypothetical protein
MMKLKNNIKLKKDKNLLESTRVNLQNSQSRSWNQDNLIKNKIKNNYKAQFLSNPSLKDEIKKIPIKKKTKKINQVDLD